MSARATARKRVVREAMPDLFPRAVETERHEIRPGPRILNMIGRN